MRYSVLTLILLLTIVALVITVWLLYANQRPMQAQIKRLRTETGQLTIIDETQIHAIRMPGDEDLEWTYRVWIAAGGVAYARCKVNDLPKVGEQPPAPRRVTANSVNGDLNGVTLGFAPGEYLIKLKLSRLDQANWSYQLSAQKSGAVKDTITGGSQVTGLTENDWPNLRASVSETGVEEQRTHAIEAGPLVLLDRRSFPMEAGASSGDSTQGVMLWVGCVGTRTEDAVRKSQ